MVTIAVRGITGLCLGQKIIQINGCSVINGETSFSDNTIVNDQSFYNNLNESIKGIGM